MTVVLLKFETEAEWLEARKQDVTSTEVAALFGLHPYMSRLRLWHIKNGTEEDEFVDNDYAELGRILQNPVAHFICRKRGWDAFDLTGYYYRDTERRLGASMDVRAVCPTIGNILLEVKTAEEFREEDGWTDMSTPLNYEFQVQTQLHLADMFGDPFDAGMIGTLGRRQKIREYPRHYDRDVGKMINDEVESFWASLKAGNPPDPDYRVDGDLLERLGPRVRLGETRNMSLNERAIFLAQKHHDLQEKIKPLNNQINVYKEEKKAVESELMHLMGDAETATIGGFIARATEQTVDDSVRYGHTTKRFYLKPSKGKKR